MEQSMTALKVLLQRQIAVGLILCMAVPFVAAETPHEFEMPQSTEVVATNGMKPASGEKVINVDGVGSQTANSDKTTSQLSQSTTPALQNTAPSAPTGTAAAPYEKQEGVSASNPAGSAIAPGKQRRIRSFAIRVGLLVGAAVAIGVVAGASLGSSSRP